MSRKNVVGNIKFSHFDDLFGEPDSVRESDIVEIPLTELYGFKNHPFKIRSDEELSEMIDSVRKYGVLVPGIARERKKGRYEIVAGHTRKHICELVGIKTMPMVIREMDDNEACLVMVDSNLQREHILPSEKAMAYRMKYDALKNQGLPGNSLKYLEKENKENYKTIQRYIWLSRLIPEFLQMLDDKRLGLVQGVNISALEKENQEIVHRVILGNKMKLSVEQSATIKQMGADGTLTEESVTHCLKTEEKMAVPRKVTIGREKLQHYFTEEYSEKEMMNVIFQLLEEWKKRGSEVHAGERNGEEG